VHQLNQLDRQSTIALNEMQRQNVFRGLTDNDDVESIPVTLSYFSHTYLIAIFAYIHNRNLAAKLYAGEYR
jgi:hypothetical protein